ncbi:mitotic deacetylase-associated SANT domain protein [Phyllopteryx taeniolatus]|uniref:mitotic deacetylase-associated SANT domain protein n=1 Tax=Phyllopteryx taeniolatus TaxID=161469 RepID=UPI002AD5344C|nr:mitotic deacetylase-associated SANT domain protein [Phyllopteryx taeniolatus]XP_061651351.1 mitotic deacetylase-associated SANT domain protein [Phyllopteryx taeniolatus]XP_061651352.1 mitotic deacetylase-associated SANT domain protein [Phyllopteryx taeniolatus]
MLAMSVPAQQKPGAKRTGKRITFFTDPTGAMKETGQHPEGSYYIQGGGEPGKSEAASGVASNPEGHRVYLNSVIFSPDKGDQNRGHYQQTVPMKWAHQDSGQQQQRAATWTTVANWEQNFANYLTDTRNQTVFAKPTQETGDKSGDKQQAGHDHAADVYRDAVKARGLEWDHRQLQSQAFQETLKPGVLNPQPNSAAHPAGSSVLQPFQLAFGQPRQHLPAYYQSFQGNARLPNPPNYSVQAKPPQQAPQLQRQNLTQQQLQQQQQIILQQQQQQQQLQMPHQQLQQQSQHVLDYYPPNTLSRPQLVHSREPMLAAAPPKIQEPLIHDITPEPPLSALLPDSLSQTQNLRRSRRLSKEGGAPSDDNPFPGDPAMQGPQNGTRGFDSDFLAAPTGVIHSAPRRTRRASQEVNLETLAQKASEMETLPSQGVTEPHRPWSPPQPGGPSMKRPRDDGLLPLVIPVSVPVRRLDLSSRTDGTALTSGWPPPPPPPRPPNPPEIAGAERKPSVIVTRRRSMRNSLTEGSEQNGEAARTDDDVKKLKRRPRPEPLFIPPPKPAAFMPPPAAVYSAVTPYQSHLRSPVRLADNPLAMPPYTPPPILSPVREGSGLYFSTFLLSSAAGGPPSATPKSATRSLLCSSSCDMTPPVLSAVSEPTPVSIEPRINLGSQYQAQVPDLRPRSLVELDTHGAELVWAPLTELEDKPDYHKRVKDLMHLACSSALCGGGSNQELAHHCLHECDGDVMAALSLLMLRNPVLPESHSLSNYHYSGSARWSAVERRQFNKGMATCKKDFFMVQKQVSTKTVAQCVEFYYSYKKHVKVGRNGTLIYGEATPPDGGTAEEETNANKASLRLQQQQREEDSRKWEGSADRKRDVGPAGSARALPSADNSTTVLIMRAQEDVVARDRPPPPPHVIGPPPGTDPSTGNKGAGGPEGEFPCKKCGRVFFKVKSRSAHMKSHAEQEKKAAALRQKEAEDRARAAAQARAAAFMAARQQNGTRQAGGDSEDDDEDGDASESEDDDNWQ